MYTGVHKYNPRTQEVETGGSQVQDYPVLHVCFLTNKRTKCKISKVNENVYEVLRVLNKVVPAAIGCSIDFLPSHLPLCGLTARHTA